MSVGLHFGKEKVIKTEVGGVHETSRKKQKQTMSINKSDPKDFFLGASLDIWKDSISEWGVKQQLGVEFRLQTADNRQ